MFSLASIQEMWASPWPIISVLLACSVFSGAVILERWFSLRRFDFDRDALLDRLRKLLAAKKGERPVGRILSYVLQPTAQDRAAGREYVERVAFRLIRTQTANMNHYLIVLG